MFGITTPMLRCAVLMIAITLWLGGCGRRAGVVEGGENFGKRLQEALIRAKPGDMIQVAAGRHVVDRPLSLSVTNVTVRGQGMDKTILSFRGNKTGSAGFLATAGGFTMEDLAIEDTPGDALKINGVPDVTVRRVRTEWTGSPNPTNGAYGIYPVQCENVLVEDSVAIGASDAGVYIGQSRNIVLRRNRAEKNVVGLEVENSTNADVYDNIATGNTGGLLVVNLPDLPVAGCRNVRIYNNRVQHNNLANFGREGAIVATVPAGTGLMVLATRDVEIFKNTIEDHGTSNVSVLTYLVTGRPVKDAKYDPFTAGVNVHDNIVRGGGDKPAGQLAEVLKKFPGALPAVMDDGIADPASKTPRLCVQNNGDARVLNLDAANKFRKMSIGGREYECTLPALAPVSLSGRT